VTPEGTPWVGWHGRPRSRARSIGQIARAILREKRFQHKGRYAALSGAWVKLVGDAVSARTRIKSFREGELTVEVNSSVLLHELDAFMKPQLLGALQATEAGADVGELRFRLGNGPAG